MCGLAGIFSYHQDASPVVQHDLDIMQQAMQARGPDGVGYWTNPEQRVGLVHRRLSILDLSAHAGQPMQSDDGRYHIVFNGEIYNFQALREDLKQSGCVFHTMSDTEVLLHLFRVHGSTMLQQLRGMYSIAIWDQKEKALFMARDPFGIKPLYYADDGKRIYFASQVKTLLALKQLDTKKSAAGHVGFYMLGHVPEPYTLYESIRAFPAGVYATIKQNGTMQQSVFCSLTQEIEHAEDTALELPHNQLKETFEQAMLDTVKAHLIADVPIAFFLSSGVDSSVLLYVARSLNYSTEALTLQFQEYQNSSKNETALAEAVAKQNDVAWHLSTVTQNDFLNEFKRIIASMDQPSIDGVNTYFVSKLAFEKGFKVAVSGLGADELLGGYGNFNRFARLSSWGSWQRYLPIDFLKPLLQLLGKMAHKEKHCALPFMLHSDASIYYLLRALYLPEEMKLLFDPKFLQEGFNQLDLMQCLQATLGNIQSPHGKMQAFESQWYMKNQLLRDSDWAGMAYSVEIRVPFVDLDLWRAVLPMRAAANKSLLFETANNHLPQEILTRKKTGFNIPVSRWYKALPNARTTKTGMQGWADVLLSCF